jgi:hypothetical protein
MQGTAPRAWPPGDVPHALASQASAEADQAKLKTLMAEQQIGPRMRAKGAELLNAIGTASKAKIAAAGLEAELAAPAPSRAADTGMTERWVDGLTKYIEEQIFFAGKGDVARTKLIADAVMKRPAMQRILSKSDAGVQREQLAMAAMVNSAKVAPRASSTTSKQAGHAPYRTINPSRRLLPRSHPTTPRTLSSCAPSVSSLALTVGPWTVP